MWKVSLPELCANSLSVTARSFSTLASSPRAVGNCSESEQLPLGRKMAVSSGLREVSSRSFGSDKRSSVFTFRNPVGWTDWMLQPAGSLHGQPLPRNTSALAYKWDSHPCRDSGVRSSAQGARKETNSNFLLPSQCCDSQILTICFPPPQPPDVWHL